MTKYAYLDKADILHIVDAEETAKRFSKNGKVVATTIKAKNGFPALFNKATKVDEEVITYGIGRAYFDVRAKRIDLAEYPELHNIFALYAQVD